MSFLPSDIYLSFLTTIQIKYMLTSRPNLNSKDFSGPNKALITGIKSSAYLVKGPALTMVCFSVPFLNVIPLVFIKPKNHYKNHYKETKTTFIGDTKILSTRCQFMTK